MDPLRVALLPFTATADPDANLAVVLAGVAQAAEIGADVLLTPECALCGYPGAGRESLAGLSACHLADREDLVHIRAEAAGLAVVLGSASLHPAGGWSNDAFCCGSIAPRRYRKQALTPIDGEHFSPGDESTVLTIAGWRLGLTICYEVRFPRYWADLALAGVDGFLSIAHMAGGDADPGTKAVVVPHHYSSRAAEWATPLAVCNTAAADRWFDAGAWDARGLALGSSAAELTVVELVHRDELHPWYRQIHADALAVAGRPAGS